MIGQWLREKRGSISLRDIARKSSISAGNISRIESGSVTDPTLSTVVRLVQALEADPVDLYQFLTGRSLLKIEPKNLYPLKYPTTYDASEFEYYAQSRSDSVSKFITPFLQLILDAQVPQEMQEQLGAQTWKGWSNPKLHLGIEGFNWLLIDANLFTWHFEYPPYVTKETLLELYSQNDALILVDDLKQYIAIREFEKARETTVTYNRKKVRGIAFEDHWIKFSKYSLFANCNFSNLLELDQEVSQQGEIFMFGWRVADAETHLFEHNEHRYAKMLLMMSRWMAFLGFPKKDWLTEIREGLKIRN